MVEEGGDTLAAVSAIPMRQNLRGAVLPMAGVAGVATHPLARRQGHVRALLRQLLDEMRDEGHPLSALYPFRPSFYEQVRLRRAAHGARTAPVLPGRPGPAAARRAARRGGAGSGSAPGYARWRAFTERCLRERHGFSIFPELPGRRAAGPGRPLADHRHGRRRDGRRADVPDRRPRRHAGRRRPARRRPVRPGAAVAVPRPARRPGRPDQRPGAARRAARAVADRPGRARRGAGGPARLVGADGPAADRWTRWPACRPGRAGCGWSWSATGGSPARHLLDGTTGAGGADRRRRRPGSRRPRSPPPGCPPWRTGCSTRPRCTCAGWARCRWRRRPSCGGSSRAPCRTCSPTSEPAGAGPSGRSVGRRGAEPWGGSPGRIDAAGSGYVRGMPEWLQAGAWGLLAGSALLIGAAVGFFARVPRRVVASVMAFGAGVLLSAVSFELIAEAHEQGGLLPTAIGRGGRRVGVHRGERAPRPTGRPAPQALRRRAALRAGAARLRVGDRGRRAARRRTGVGGDRREPAGRRPGQPGHRGGGLPQQRAGGAVQRRRHAPGRPVPAVRLPAVDGDRADQRRRGAGRLHPAGRCAAGGAGRHHRAGRRRDPRDDHRHDGAGGVRGRPPAGRPDHRRSASSSPSPCPTPEHRGRRSGRCAAWLSGD